MSTPSPSAIILGTLLATRLVRAESGTLWLEPSKQWYGVDGNWSSIGLNVGEPAQQVDVIVSTSLSEIWVIGTDGCSADDTSCAESHGGLYNKDASNSWSGLGTWQLGMSSFGLQGKGDYAMENISVHDSTKKQQTPLGKQLVAAIAAETDFYTGYFGLGINPVNFKDVAAQSPIDALAKRAGTIGSRGYGYTAGAYYAGAGGMPLSLTLGGYDENRFQPHDTTFPLNSSTNELEVSIEQITASVSDFAKQPADWPATAVQLAGSSEKTRALIDSSTPFLWLPLAMCDNFAQAFNLEFNETFGLYFFSDDGLERFRAASDLMINFAFAHADSGESDGAGLETVTITLSANAFIQELRYPYPNVEGGPDAAPMPYFPLKRQKDGGKVIIGRTFLQEAYLITNYETGTFSIHQAVFPDDPVATSIKALSADDSVQSASQSTPEGHIGLTKDQLAGIVAGSAIGVVAIGVAIWWIWRKMRRSSKKGNGYGDAPRGNGSAARRKVSFKTATAGLLSKIAKNSPGSRSRRNNAHIQSNERHYPFNQTKDYAYDTPSPLPAVELGARRVRTMNDTAEPFPGHREDTLGYEIARMGLDPLPVDLGCEYGPPPQEMAENTYNSQESSTVASAQTPSSDLGLKTVFPISPDQDEYSEESHSPLSPYQDSRGEWAHDMARYPSSQPLVTPRITTTRSDSERSGHSTAPDSALHSVSSQGSLAPAATPSLIQRTPIDSSQQVVCLGPLPNHIQRPHQFPFPPPPIPPSPPPPPSNEDGLDVPNSLRSRWNRISTAETLGSNYTVEEEARGRIHGSDIVHIPDVPERRYSWEN